MMWHSVKVPKKRPVKYCNWSGRCNFSIWKFSANFHISDIFPWRIMMSWSATFINFNRKNNHSRAFHLKEDIFIIFQNKFVKNMNSFMFTPFKSLLIGFVRHLTEASFYFKCTQVRLELRICFYHRLEVVMTIIIINNTTIR